MDAVGKVTCDHRVGDPVIAYVLDTCPRCLGTGEYGGVVFGSDGKIATQSKGPQLSQQIKKILTENRRSTGYGFDYKLLRGVVDRGRITAIQGEILRCMDYLKVVQKENKKQGFYYNPQEEMGSIVLDTLLVKQDSLDLRNVLVSFSVLSVSGSPLSINVVLRR